MAYPHQEYDRPKNFPTGFSTPQFDVEMSAGAQLGGQSAIEQQLGVLEANTAALLQALQGLETRLRPVLTPVLENAGPDKDNSRPQMSFVANKLADTNFQLDRLRMALHALEQRIDL